jgi:DNA-binding NarL/FixJ family response regulator
LLDVGCQVLREASNGTQAIGLATGQRPDIIVLDITMPGISGLDVAKVLRERLPQMRIIFVTEKRDQSYVDQAFALGAQACVLKSLAATELPLAVREVSAGRLFRRLADGRM